MLDGLLFFPVTPFTATGEVDLGALGEHIAQRLDAGPGAVFVACGTGESHALDRDESAAVAGTAVRTVAGRVPVFAGVGGPLPTAVASARAAEAAGVDGLLLMPPYLVTGPIGGLASYVRGVAAAVALPIIVYQRGTAVFAPDTVADLAGLPTILGFKDGRGDLELMQRTVIAVRSRIGTKPFQFFNGLPTAELTQRAYRAIGVDLYSSAVFAFAPEIALAFHRVLSAGDETRVLALLENFYVPLAEIRNRVPGYAVSLIKAGVRLRGLDAGGVRPPLVDPTDADVRDLRELLDRGLDLVAGQDLVARQDLVGRQAP